jgi:hypothetical protein
VFLIDYVVLMRIIIQLGWLSWYEAIDITDELPRLECPRLGIFISIELWLRLVQVAFNVLTVIYFGVGYWLAHGVVG